ncbi:MAG: OmpH family outer membrane protein [Acidobacteria bacterium]|uniref:OmpH family outer membrane protein n=1 Tax=Candidatus Sulfomarinibacter kjeldsenii TaxID=2885994 RepID=A0A8J7CNE5_9BACT|nr:OmpH family outer membrane protein [Candidatus Sulfomarinibacter kjeldsenii]
MQIFARGILALIAVFVAIPAVAGNVGFLDSERAIKTVKEGQRQLQILNEWANQKSDIVEGMQSRVAELTQQLNTQRTVASADAIRQLEDELLQAQRRFEDAGRTLQRDFEAKQKSCSRWLRPGFVILPASTPRATDLTQYSCSSRSRWSISRIRPSSRTL